MLWELSRAEAPLTFRALQAAAETNPGVLNTRLKELRAAGVVAHDAGGYGLSEAGSALLRLILPLHAWAQAWGARPDPVQGAASGAARKTRVPGRRGARRG